MTENNPMVSVVIATYNREKTLGRAIESALGQSYGNMEIVVVDDGSTDGTRAVVQSYANNSKVKYLYQKNRGCHTYPMNHGIGNAQGKYIAILDDDDFWCDVDKIKKQVDFLEKNTGYVLVGGGAIKIDQDGKEITRYLLPQKDADIRKKILTSNAFVHVTAFYRKDAWEKAGGYDENFDGIEDWDLWLRMGNLGRFYNVQDFFVSYTGHRRTNPSYTEKKYGRVKWLELNIKLKKKYKEDYPGYTKAVALCWARFLYSYLPFGRELWPFLFNIRKSLFGGSMYK